MDKTKKDRFIEGLKDYNLSYDEIVKSGWNYCGGNYKQHLNYYKLRFPNEELLPHAIECVCGHDIEKNGYICNKEETEFLVLGSCCIKKFIGGRTCENCGNKHKRTSVNCCFNCEKFRRFLQYEERFIYLDSMKCDGDNCNERLIKHSWKTTCYNCYIVKKEMARINFN